MKTSAPPFTRSSTSFLQQKRTVPSGWSDRRVLSGGAASFLHAQRLDGLGGRAFPSSPCLPHTHNALCGAARPPQGFLSGGAAFFLLLSLLGGAAFTSSLWWWCCFSSPFDPSQPTLPRPSPLSPLSPLTDLPRPPPHPTQTTHPPPPTIHHHH